MFTVRYSIKGSNDRIKEENAYAYLVDYLDGCERTEYVNGE